MPALLNALALIAPCSMPSLMWSFYQRSSGALSAGEPDAGPPLWFQKRLLAAGQNLRRCLSFRAGPGLHRAGSSGTTGRRDPARSAGNASLQWPRARLVPDAEIGATRYQRAGDRHGRDPHDLQEATPAIRRGSGWRSSTIISAAIITGRSPWKS